MEIIELYNKLKQIGLSPNEFTVLSFMNKNIIEKFNFNEHLSKRILRKNGFLDKEDNFTQKSKELFNNTDIEDPIKSFREIFPKGVLPNGRLARSTYQELDNKFKWFTKNYDYSWNLIIKATKEYVKYFEKQNYRYMQTASNFISKQDVDRVKSSTLAEWCEKMKSGDEISQELDINV